MGLDLAKQIFQIHGADAAARASQSGASASRFDRRFPSRPDERPCCSNLIKWSWFRFYDRPPVPQRGIAHGVLGLAVKAVPIPK